MLRVFHSIIAAIIFVASSALFALDPPIQPLNSEEKQYLETLGSIKLCTGPDTMPLDDIISGRHVGIGAEYIKLFSNFIDTPIELVLTETWDQSLEYIKAARCDIIALITSTPQREEYLSFTQTYVQIPFVMVTTQEKFFVSRLSQLVDKKLGIQKGYAYVDLLKNRFPEINLIEVDNRNEGLRMVASGELYGYFSGLNLAGYALQEGGFTQLKINGQFDEMALIKLGLATRKDLEPLVGIFNKAIASIEPKVKKRIDNSWLTIRYEIAEDYQRLIQIMITALVVLTFVAFRHYHLKKLNRELFTREKQIWKQANYDFLTGLPNRRLFHDRLAEQIKRVERYQESFALLLIDLDEFKDVNDTQGHEQGDRLLIEAAKRIKHCIRESDTIARLGGDEFVVILKEINGPSTIEVVATKILQQLQTPFALNQDAFVSASIGITLCPQDTLIASELLTNADQAMYAAKSSGRNNYHYFTSSMQETAQERAMLIRELRNAIESNQFEIYYQPIEDLKDGSIYKAEALIRWNHPEKGLISPISFIPLLEETRMIIELGEWIFIESAKQAEIWRNKYQDNFQVNVNTSPLQFQSQKTQEWYAHLGKLNISPAAVGIEITESMLMEGQDNISHHLIDLRDLGFQVALDDFGTGYSSLSYLKKFDIDYLKIDKSFVNQIAEDTDDKILCEAIIIMAHRLGLKVVAEGIETMDQKVLLTSMGCDYGQGYQLSPPVPVDKFEQLIESHNKT
jgi:diguanylate cyclase (GGDEF)-like protein